LIEKQELEHKCNTLHTEREIISQHLQTQQRDLSTTSQTIQSLQRKIESSIEKEKKLEVENDQLVQENLRLAKSVSEQNQNYRLLEENFMAIQSKYQHLDREQKDTKQKMRTDQDTIKNLEEEIVKLSGHSNSKQKIQYYASVKKDLLQLKAEREKLNRELLAKDQYIKKMMEDKKRGNEKSTDPVIIKLLELYKITKGPQDIDVSSTDSLLKCITILSDSYKQLLFINDLNQKELLLLRKEKFLQDKQKNSELAPLNERPQNIIISNNN